MMDTKRKAWEGMGDEAKALERLALKLRHSKELDAEDMKHMPEGSMEHEGLDPEERLAAMKEGASELGKTDSQAHEDTETPAYDKAEHLGMHEAEAARERGMPEPVDEEHARVRAALRIGKHGSRYGGR